MQLARESAERNAKKQAALIEEEEARGAGSCTAETTDAWTGGACTVNASDTEAHAKVVAKIAVTR